MVKKDFLKVYCNKFYLWSPWHAEVPIYQKTLEGIKNNINDLHILLNEC